MKNKKLLTDLLFAVVILAIAAVLLWCAACTLPAPGCGPS